MKILMLVNWKVRKTETVPDSLQPPDYHVEGEDYWFYRYFKDKPEVDIVDISSFGWLERFEKNRIRFYIWQSLKSLHKLNKYDLIISHGMQSGIVICLFRRLFRTKSKHIVFDIGSFSSASEAGAKLKLMQFASKSIDSLIYHTSTQREYYSRFFPWLVGKSRFLRYGADIDFYNEPTEEEKADKPYFICIGYSKRDWPTLIEAYKQIDTDVTLKLVGHVEEEYTGIKNIEQIPFVSINELISLISGSIAGILPLEAFNYSFGQMTLLQQMALGKCVITADVPSIRDYVNDGDTAITYKPKNVDDLIKKIVNVLENHDLRKQIGLNAREWVRNNCNEQIMASEIERVIKETI